MDKVFGTDTSYYDEDDDEVSQLFNDRILDDKQSLLSHTNQNTGESKQRTQVTSPSNKELRKAQIASQLMRFPELSQK